MMLLGARLEALRKVKGFSRTELARLIGRDHKAIGRWERGETTPRADDLVSLSKTLGVSMDALLGEQKMAVYI